MASSVLLSTLLMGVLLLAIVLVMLRFRDWERGPEARDRAELVDRTLGSTAVWTATFVLLALGIGGAVVAVVSGAPVPLPEDFWGLLVVFLAPFLLLLGLYAFAGVYSSARSRGLSNAPAVGIASVVVATLVLVAVVVKLFVEGG